MDRLFSRDEVDKAMKRQEIILRAMSGELKWYQAAQILGVSDRQMRRIKTRYEHMGYDGLYDRRKKEPSPRRIPFEQAERVLHLYREEYMGWNVSHFYDELQSEHGFEVSYTWTKLALQGAGLVKKHKKRGQYRRRRERRPQPGMLLHLDGSFHRWFESKQDERQCLIALMDDATNECLAGRFFRQEGTRQCLSLIKEVVENRGTFISLYTDRASHFVYTRKAGDAPDMDVDTQIKQVLEELGIELIVARSPEARGRSERMWGTWQGRLPMELKKAGIRDYSGANRYLNEVFIRKYNKRFMVEPAEQGSSFLKVVGANLEHIFSLREKRTVAKDSTISFKNTVIQLPRIDGITTLRGRKVTVRQSLDGTLRVFHGKRLIGEFQQDGLLIDEDMGKDKTWRMA